MSKMPHSYNIGDLILYSYNDARTEAIVIDIATNSVQIKTIEQILWVGLNNVKDNLGPANNLQRKIFGLEPLTKAPPNPSPAPPTTKPYRTGTYIIEGPDGPALVDVDKIDNVYFIRLAGMANTHKLSDELWDSMYEFSDPDKGDYVVEPGIYLVPEDKESIEVIPYNGVSYYRFLDNPLLLRLPKDFATILKRFESDSLDINAIMIIDKSEMDNTKECKAPKQA